MEIKELGALCSFCAAPPRRRGARRLPRVCGKRNHITARASSGPTPRAMYARVRHRLRFPLLSPPKWDSLMST
jgi:hypothetical protein